MSGKDGKISIQLDTSRKYSDAWELEFDWVSRDPNAPFQKAYCKTCKRSLFPNRPVLISHQKSSGHKSMTEFLETNQEPKFGRTRRQGRNESILLRQTLSKSELELNEGDDTSIMVVSSNSSDPDPVSILPDVSDLVKISNISHKPTTTMTVVSDKSEDPYTISIVEEVDDGEGEGVLVSEEFTTEDTRADAQATAGVVVGRQLNLGLVDVNKMNIQEMDLLESDQTIMVMHHQEEEEAQDEAGQLDQQSLGPSSVMPNEFESHDQPLLSSLVQVSALEHFDQTIKPELIEALKTGEDYDVVWKCDDGLFKVHKSVLAISSEFFKGMMNEDENICIIQTPGLRKEIVQSILCLFYCGKVSVTWELLNDINESFKTLGFFGNNLTAFPQEEENENIDIDYPSTEIIREQYIKPGRPPKQKPKPSLKKARQEPIQDPLEFLDEFAALQEELMDSEDEYVPETQENIDDSSDEDIDLPETEDILHNIKTESASPKKRRGRKRKVPARFDGDPAFKTPYKVEEPKSKDLYETIATYTLRTRGKGELSLSLKDDMFDDHENSDSIKHISVCLACLAYFDDYEKLKAHKRKVHSKKRLVFADYSKEILGDNQYKCSKCKEKLSLKHVVWFVKHKKFCGLDDEKAMQLLSPTDVEENNAKTRLKEEESVTFVVADRGRNCHEMSRFFFNKDVHTIWSCRICYEVFSNQNEYDKHQSEVHQGSTRHGSCYDPETRTFTCMYCNTYKTSRQLIHFIYHLKRCLCDPSLGEQDSDIDELDEDNTQDVIDPWGIVNKPLRVLNDKAKWICEALFGRYIPILYPCHICYTVYELEDELKEHFRLSHPGQENCCDNGPHYDRERELYVCPVCKRQVCHKQKSAIYFTHHLRKCSGETHPVSRSCPQCQKTFTSFRPYMFHTKNNCETKEFMCHICSQNFKDVKYLASHLSYVHSTARPYQCMKCDKSYKRRAELQMHMQTHQDTMEYSCEKCGKAFHRKRNLKIHMTTHLSEAEKRYACHLCSHRFSKKSFLVNHLTTHSSFRRFACEVCGSQVKTRDSLKQHRKRVHKLNTPLPQACILQVETEIDPKLTTTTTVVVKEETVIEEFHF